MARKARKKKKNNVNKKDNTNVNFVATYDFNNAFTRPANPMEFTPYSFIEDRLNSEADGFRNSPLATYLKNKYVSYHIYKPYFLSIIEPIIKKNTKKLKAEGLEISYSNIPKTDRQKLDTALGLFALSKVEYQEMLKLYYGNNLGTKYIKDKKIIPHFQEMQNDKDRKRFPINKEKFIKFIQKESKKDKYKDCKNTLDFLTKIELQDFFTNHSNKAVFLSYMFRGFVPSKEENKEEDILREDMGETWAEDVINKDNLNDGIDYRSFLAFAPWLSKKQIAKERDFLGDRFREERIEGIFYLTIKDILMIIFNCSLQEAVKELKIETKFENNPYVETYKDNLEFLKNTKKIKRDYPYSYKFLKSSIDFLRFLNEDGLNKVDLTMLNSDFLEYYNGEMVTNNRHTFFSSLSYICKNLGLDQRRQVLVQTRLISLSIIGLVNIADPFTLDAKTLNKSLTIALKSGLKYIINYYSIPNIREQMDSAEEIAKILYDRGVRPYFHKAKNVIALGEVLEELKSELSNDLKDGKDTERQEQVLKILHNRYKIISQSLDVRDIAEIIRKKTFEEKGETFKEVAKIAKEFDDLRFKNPEKYKVLREKLSNNNKRAWMYEGEGFLRGSNFKDMKSNLFYELATSRIAPEISYSVEGEQDYLKAIEAFFADSKKQLQEEGELEEDLKEDDSELSNEYEGYFRLMNIFDDIESLKEETSAYYRLSYIYKLPSKKETTRRMREIEEHLNSIFEIPKDLSLDKQVKYVNRFNFKKTLASNNKIYGNLEFVGKGDPKNWILNRQSFFISAYSVGGDYFIDYRTAGHPKDIIYNAYIPLNNMPVMIESRLKSMVAEIYPGISKKESPWFKVEEEI